MSQIKILIVEDNPRWRRLIQRTLKKLPFPCEIKLAANDDEAEAALNQNTFDIITLDMSLSQEDAGDGWYFVRHLRRGHYPKAKDARIVVVSGSTNPGQVAELLTQYGVETFIWKNDYNWDDQLSKIVENIQREQEADAQIEAEKSKAPPTIFISYSHEDEKEKNRLLAHLGVLQHGLDLDLWSDDRIGAGEEWEKEISQAIRQASIAILLVTVNFLTSKFILSKEIPALLKRREREGLIIFPVIAKACAWTTVEWLAKMRVRPDGGTPIWGGGGSHVDEYLSAIVEEISVIVEKISKTPK